MSAPVDVLETPEHLDEQAALAIEYANERPVSDLKGFFAALRDAEEFQRDAARARARVGVAA